MLHVIDAEAVETAISVLYEFEQNASDAIDAKTTKIYTANAKLLEICKRLDNEKADYRGFLDEAECVIGYMNLLRQEINDLSDELAHFNNARILLEETINSEE